MKNISSMNAKNNWLKSKIRQAKKLQLENKYYDQYEVESELAEDYRYAEPVYDDSEYWLIQIQQLQEQINEAKSELVSTPTVVIAESVATDETTITIVNIHTTKLNTHNRIIISK